MSKVVTCYICGLPIEPGHAVTEDHRVPKLLLKKQQPRRRGFDYGGVAPTHAKCNNGFRDEASASAALRILWALGQPNAALVGVHPDDPSIPIQALNEAVFGSFTAAELAFFNIRDGRSSDALPSVDEVRKGTTTNLAREALPIALSVLVKSAAALLVERHGLSPSASRSIWAVAYTTGKDFRQTLQTGGFVAFHEDVYWKVTVEHEVIEVRYYAHGVLAFFWFLPPDALDFQRRLIAALPNQDHWWFEAASLNDLLTKPWMQVYRGTHPPTRNSACGCGSLLRFKNCHGALIDGV